MWSGCAGRLSAERNGIILFLKKSPHNYDFIRRIKKVKNMLSSAQKILEFLNTGNDVISSILTVSCELRLATADVGCRWNRSVLVLEVFLAYQSSAFPSTTPIRFYMRISEFSSDEQQSWGEGFTPGLDILIFCFCHLAVSKQHSGCDVTQW